MMKRYALLILLLFLISPAVAQRAERPLMTPADERLGSLEQRRQLQEASLVANVELVNVGPTVMSGRVSDVAVNPSDPTEFYVAYASGGLWHTTNNGLSFDPVFDDEAVMTLGDIDVDWASGTVWAGTGEDNSSRSSYAGTGVYKSTNGGVSWQQMGLAETHHTGRLVLHPTDPNTVWVAAVGHLYSPNAERGVYKTTDGGATWEKVLFVDDNTGAIDLVVDPANPNLLYAAMWYRERRAWNFVESGEGSGIFKSTDGGTTWTRLNTATSGFPTGGGVGRIGLAMAADGGTLYALLDNQNRRPEEEEDEAPAMTRDMIREMSKTQFLKVGEDALEDYLRENGFPAAYTAQSILEMIAEDKIAPMALVEYLEDANRDLFDTPVIGAEVYRSTDGGETWTKTHEDYIDALYYSYGYYFGEIAVAPDDPQRLYIMGVPILKSEDGGATWISINEPNVHVDHHALWVSASRPGHLINGNDGGLNISYDDGETWFKANTPPVGQFYTVQVDQAAPFNIYGGLQDNGVWKGPHTYEPSSRWYAEGDYPYERLLGGDGMQIEIDNRDNATVYTGFQFGNYFRIDGAEGRRTSIKPSHELGERPLRFNWQTPIHLSLHNQDILYYGSQKLHRSFNQGTDWETLSGDLTKGGKKGDVPFGTLTTIDESPLRFGLLYVGSDDGYIHVSRDAGTNWTRISESLPQDLWVSRVEASNHALGRVYVSLNGYRQDHFDAYVYGSDDYGQTWQRLGEDLPMEPVNVVLEDPANEHVLYVGTDHGLYVSLNRGASFMAMQGGLPAAPVHDLKMQARDKTLVVGTHGRSIFTADVQHLQQLTPEMIARAVHVFDLGTVTHNPNWGDSFASWSDPTVPETWISYFAGQAGNANVQIRTEEGTVLRTITDSAERGLNYLSYDLAIDPDAALSLMLEEDDEKKPLEAGDNDEFYLPPGTYIVAVSLGGETATGTLEIKEHERRGGNAEPGMEPGQKEKIK